MLLCDHYLFEFIACCLLPPGRERVTLAAGREDEEEKRRSGPHTLLAWTVSESLDHFSVDK